MLNDFNKIKITIITPVYNAARTIEQSILSVINQDYSNIEYIIIDGKSVDGTIDIIKRYESKISFWISEKDTGIYNAMNKGIKRATGDYVYFLGADDCLINKKIVGDICRKYLWDLSIDVLSGQVWSINDKCNMQQLFDNNYSKSIKEDIKYGNIRVPHQGMFVKTLIMKKLMFDEKYKIGSDYKLILQLWINNDYFIKKVKEAIAFYSKGGISNRDHENRYFEHCEILKEFYQIEFKIKRLSFFEKFKVRTIEKIIDIGLGEIYLTLRGWEKHSCKNVKCRWCNR